MKKMTLVLLAGAMALWLAACAQTAPTTDQPTADLPPTGDEIPAPPMPATDTETALPVQSGPVSDPEQLIGKLPPAFSLKDMEGKTVDLVSLRGKPVVLDFWATWCPPCRELSPAVDRIHREYGDRITVLALSDEERELVKSYTQEHDLTATQLALTDDVSRNYGITGIPTTVFIDRDGAVRHVQVGLFTDGQGMADQYEALKSQVEALLAS